MWLLVATSMSSIMIAYNMSSDNYDLKSDKMNFRFEKLLSTFT